MFNNRKRMRGFSIILASDATNGIAKNGKIPWHSKEDMQHFKKITKGHIVIMGRKTHESIGKNLPDRVNLVISQNYTLDSALKECENYPDKSIFIIGGAQIYNMILQDKKYHKFIHYIYHTIISEIYNCDVVIEPYSENFQLIDTKTINEGVILTYIRPNLDELQYLRLVNHIIRHGYDRDDRTGVGTKSLFGINMVYDISNNTIPLLTTKFVSFKTIFHELKWFLNGIPSIEYMKKHKVKIWDKNVEANDGKVGPMYPWQWRHYGAEWIHDEIESTTGIDQISNMIHLIRTDPMSRRILLSNWNPSDIPKGCLPPCHITFQIYVHGHNNEEISGLLNMRSNDLGLGHPYNIVSYSLLLHMIAHVTNKKATRLHLMLGDTHVYKNHIGPLEEQLKRNPVHFPSIKITKETDNIDDLTIDDFILFDYEHEPRILMEMSV